MPVGRFRDDPRELEDTERVVTARQYAEGLHVLGSLLGLSVPYLLGAVAPSAPGLLLSPLGSILGLLVGGVSGYLLGDRYARRSIERRRSASETSSEGRAAVEDGGTAAGGDETA